MNGHFFFTSYERNTPFGSSLLDLDLQVNPVESARMQPVNTHNTHHAKHLFQTATCHQTPIKTLSLLNRASPFSNPLTAMAALCHFPTPPPPPSLSNLLSRSKPRSPLVQNLPIQNPNPNFITIASKPRRLSSPAAASSSEAASTPAIEVSPSLGDITRRDFSTLHQAVNGFNRVYFDNATASKMPDAVLKALNEYYESYNSNVHRGVHSLSAKATDAYELARAKVATFINATGHREIVFTRNASEAINLVAYSWGLSNLRSGDEILLTIAEHHSAIAPWQLVAKKTGATLKYVGLTDDEVPNVQELKKLLSTKTKLVVTHHISNTLGFVLPINEIVAWSHETGAKVLVDACQSVPHMAVDVQKLDVDFLVASSHKMCGPTGIGFLYGKNKILSAMPPYLGGGEMIADVFQDYSTFADPPSRFEAGTPAIAEAIGLGSAIDYLTSIGMQKIHDYEKEMAIYLYHSLLSVPNVRIYGPPPSQAVHRSPLCSFTVENIPSKAIATHLSEKRHVAIGSGHHCAHPLHHYLGIEASSRVSLRFYNTKDEVDYFIQALKDTIRFYTS